MDEMEKATADLKAAEARVKDIMKRSTRALVMAGMLPTRVTDPMRLAVLQEIADEMEGKL